MSSSVVATGTELFNEIDLSDLYRFQRAFDEIANSAVEEKSAELAMQLSHAVELVALDRETHTLDGALAKFLIAFERGQGLKEEELARLMEAGRRHILRDPGSLVRAGEPPEGMSAV